MFQGFFEKEIGALNLSEGVNAILLSEYKRIFRTMFAVHEETYELSKKVAF